MADAEDEDAFLYGNGEDGKKDLHIKEEKEQITSGEENTLLKEDEIKKEHQESKPNDKEAKENEAPEHDDDAKEAGELSNEDDEDDDDDDDDDDVQVTIGEINTAGAGYGTPYATPVSWNFKGSAAAASATKGTPGAGSKHLDLNAEGTVNGVGIYEFDMESVEEKPWRKPGADITDYFNYGFTEDTWKQYCEKQRRMRLELTMQKKIFTHHAGATITPGQPDINAVMTTDARGTRKAGPPPERRMEGSIDVIGAVGSRVESRRHQDEEIMPPHMIGDGMPPDTRARGMQKRGFPGNQNVPPGMPPVSGPPMSYLATSDHSMGPPPHVGPPISSMAGPPNIPMHQGMPPRFPPGGPPGGPGGMPGMMPPGMQQPPPGVNQPPANFPPDGMPQDALGFPGRGGVPGHGRGRGRGFVHPGMPGMPPPGEFPGGMDERGGPRMAFEDGIPPFYPGDPMQPFPQMMGPPPHGMPWEAGLGRGFMPNFRGEFPVGLQRPGGESPGRQRSDDDSEYASSEDERRRERDHKKRDKEKDRERSREHRERTRDRHADRDRSPRRERDRDRRDRDRDRESRRHRDRDKDREKGSDRDREKREERSSRRERSKDQKKRHKGSSEAQSTDGQEEGEVVSRRKSRRTRESKQQEVKVEPSEQEEGQLPSP